MIELLRLIGQILIITKFYHQFLSPILLSNECLKIKVSRRKRDASNSSIIFALIISPVVSFSFRRSLSEYQSFLEMYIGLIFRRMHPSTPYMCFSIFYPCIWLLCMAAAMRRTMGTMMIENQGRKSKYCCCCCWCY